MKKLLIPCLLVFFTGCVDKDYDKEIDMNVTIAENGISIPIGETDRFTLSKLISTDDNLKINNDSIYYISESTETSTEFAAMKSVIIDPSNGLTPDIEPTEIALSEEIVAAVEAGITYDATIPLLLSADVPIDPSNLIVSEDVNASTPSCSMLPNEPYSLSRPKSLPHKVRPTTHSHYRIWR